MIDRVTGITAAAPTPITARSAISVLGSETSIASPAAVPKTTSPTMRMPLRPNRSPRAPAGSSSPAKTRVYASTIHVTSVCEAPVLIARSGSATFSPLTAETTIISASATTTRTPVRCRGVRAGAAVEARLSGVVVVMGCLLAGCRQDFLTYGILHV